MHSIRSQYPQSLKHILHNARDICLNGLYVYISCCVRCGIGGVVLTGVVPRRSCGRLLLLLVLLLAVLLLLL